MVRLLAVAVASTENRAVLLAEVLAAVSFIRVVGLRPPPHALTKPVMTMRIGTSPARAIRRRTIRSRLAAALSSGQMDSRRWHPDRTIGRPVGSFVANAAGTLFIRRGGAHGADGRRRGRPHRVWAGDHG